MQFSKDQQYSIDQRSKSLLVSASAGSGKTAVLVERLCRMVLDDEISLDRILAVTFTEDAASEIKNRLKKRLTEAMDHLNPNATEKKAYLQRQLTLLETAQISTIHGFCLNLLSQYYYLLNLDYSMVRRVENGLIASAALERAYRKATENLDDEAYIALKLYFEAYGKKESDLQEAVLDFIELAQSKENPDEWMKQAYRAPFNDWFFKYFKERITAMMEILDVLYNQVSAMEFGGKNGPKQQENYLQTFESKKNWLQNCLQDLEAGDYETFTSDFDHYFNWTNHFTNKINKEDFSLLVDQYKKSLETQVIDHLYSKDLYERIHEELKPIAQAFIDLALQTRKYFGEEKKKEGFIDFSDMEQFAAQLLADEQLADTLKERFEAVLIDEYQDTNELQESILSRVSRKDNVFRVGDVKQSIYRFRQAKPDLMRSWMKVNDKNHEVVYLKENYRSSKTLVHFNNDFYTQLMNASPFDSQFSAMDEALPAVKDLKEKPVRFLYTQYGGWIEPGAEKPNDNKAKSVHGKNRYDLIAKDILKKVDEGYDFRDIAILSRASTNHDQISEALEAWGIPSISRIKKGFYTNQAVQIVLSALRAIQNPRDDISLMAFLCSKLGGANQAIVAEAVAKNPQGRSLYDAVRFEPFMKNFGELQFLKDLPPAEALRKLYNYKNYYYYQTSRQDKTNLDLLLQKAVEAQDRMNLDEFLKQSSLEAHLDKTGEAFPYGKESNVVQIKTIHSSKGLQYKIVYLLSDTSSKDSEATSPVNMDADLGLAFKGLDEKRRYKRPSASTLALQSKRYKEETEEKMRLLYVATTRAEQELVFVDTIRSIQDYLEDLNTHTMLKSKSFTGWFFHLYNNHHFPQVELEEQFEILERPKSKRDKKIAIPLREYKGPVLSFVNEVASRKLQTKWKELSFESGSGMERGNLFHEMAEKLPYPYSREDAAAFAREYGMELDERDLDQFLSLNDNKEYSEWMKADHQFEYPYVVNELTEGKNRLIHGFMDFVSENGDTIHIVDFKTDAKRPELLIRQYRDQLTTYRKAMSLIHPEKKVEAYLYSFTHKTLKKLED